MKERSKKDAQKEQVESEAPIINPLSNTLLLTNGGFAGQAPPNGMHPVSVFCHCALLLLTFAQAMTGYGGMF